MHKKIQHLQQMNICNEKMDTICSKDGWWGVGVHHSCGGLPTLQSLSAPGGRCGQWEPRETKERRFVKLDLRGVPAALLLLGVAEEARESGLALSGSSELPGEEAPWDDSILCSMVRAWSASNLCVACCASLLCRSSRGRQAARQTETARTGL